MTRPSEAWDLAKGLLVVSARLTHDQPDSPGSSFGDGFVTRLGTFQKFYEQHELREWIDAVLATQSVAASPGVFYVFRDPTARERFLQSRYRRRAAAPRQSVRDKLFEEHRPLLEPLMAFLDERGRLPAAGEIAEVPGIVEALGSLKVAFQVVKHATGEERWTAVRKGRMKDLLVYLALSRFGGRPRYSQLPEETRPDIRALFSTYNRACAYSDELLFMAGKMPEVDSICRQSKIGKLTSDALYIHRSALEELHPLLRVYEGCARVLVGDVEGANIIKLRRDEPRVTYLRYPTFDKDAHPALHSAEHVNLRTLDVEHLSYEDPANPPILHRKETFVADSYPHRDMFARLTKQEEQRGLYTETQTIGTASGWRDALLRNGVTIRGHRLIRLGARA